MPTKETQDIIDGIRQLEAIETTVEQALRFEDGCIVCSTLQGGTLFVFDLSGHLLQRTPVQAGEKRVKLLPLKGDGVGGSSSALAQEVVPLPERSCCLDAVKLTSKIHPLPLPSNSLK